MSRDRAATIAAPQLGAPDGLGEIRRNAQLSAARQVIAAIARSEHQNHRLDQFWRIVNSLHQLESIHFGHVDVGQDQAEGLAPLDAAPHVSQSFRAAGGGRRLHPPTGQHVGQDAPVGKVIVDHHHADSRQRDGFARLESAGFRLKTPAKP